MFRRSGPAASGAASSFGVFFLAGCALIAGAVFASADSTPRRQYRETHVGVAPSSLVVLQSGGLGGVNLKFYAAHPDGTLDGTEFAVPAGYRLVVTDVDWAGVVPSASHDILRIWIENRTTTTTRTTVYMRTDEAYAGSSGGGNTPCGGSSGTFTGFSVSAAGRLTADVATNFGFTTAYPAYTPSGFPAGFTVILRGYLVPDA